MDIQELKIGEQLRTYRERLGLNQGEVATLAGVSQTALSYIETGKRPPNSRTLMRVAKALGCEVRFTLIPITGE